MVQDGVPDLPRAGPDPVLRVPAEHDKVGPGRQADQYPSRVTLDEVVADLDIRILAPPVGQHAVQLPGRLLLDRRPAWGRERPRGVPDLAGWHVQSVHGDQAGL